MASPVLMLPLLCAALCFAAAAVSASDDLVITKVERKIDLQSHVVRHLLALKVENVGSAPVSRFLLALSPSQHATLSFTSLVQVHSTARGKNRAFTELELVPLSPSDPPPPAPVAGVGLHSFLTAQLQEPLAAGASATLEAYLTFSGALEPFPEEITQSESQLLLLQDNAFLTSPYSVKTQTTVVKLPSSRIESFDAPSPSRKMESELKLGPYEGTEPLAFAPLRVHFEFQQPLAVAFELSRELEVSHWGNVYVTEDYDIGHEGAKLKGPFSRLDMQTRPQSSGVSALKGLAANLPKRARAVYFRDEIGNISTSFFRSEKRRSLLELAPRYPLFGGWRTTFTIGYSVPLPDLVSVLPDGTRILNASFGTPFQELPIKKLTVKVVLPEGSWGVQAQAPFDLDGTRRETKFSYLDVAGRPVVVLVKENVVHEHSVQFFQVQYHFSPLSLFAEPLLLTAAFAAFFIACAIYVRLDLTIAKLSPAYQAMFLTDVLMDSVQRLQDAVSRRLRCVEVLETSLRNLGRAGDLAQAKAVRKIQEEQLKDLQKHIKDALAAIQGVPKAPKAQALAERLVAKDAEYVDKELKKYGFSLEAFEKSLPEKEIEKVIVPLVESLSALKAEVKSLLTLLDD